MARCGACARHARCTNGAGAIDQGETRNLRRDAIHHLKDALKKHEISENDERRAQDEVQKMTDRHIAEIDKLLQQKETELMAV